MLKIKSVVPEDIHFFIGYKYNYQKFLYFINTEDAGISNDGMNYLSKHPELFDNVSTIPVAPPLSCLSYFYQLMMLTLTTNPVSLT